MATASCSRRQAEPGWLPFGMVQRWPMRRLGSAVWRRGLDGAGRNGLRPEHRTGAPKSRGESHMSMPGIDVTEIVRNTAGKYLGGDVSNMSKEELVSQVKTLAAKDPAKADQMMSEVGDKIDMKTGGKFAGKVDQLQDMVKQQLGI